MHYILITTIIFSSLLRKGASTVLNYAYQVGFDTFQTTMRKSRTTVAGPDGSCIPFLGPDHDFRTANWAISKSAKNYVNGPDEKTEFS